MAQVKARLSEYLREVKSGGEVVITERGVPIARIVPLDANERRATREERLIRAGILRPAQAPRKPLGRPTHGGGTALLEALLAERNEGF